MRDEEQRGDSNRDVSVTQALGKMRQFFVMPRGEHASEIAFSRSMFVCFHGIVFLLTCT